MYSSSISPQELNALPKAAFTGEIVVLDKLGKSFDEAVAYLSTQKVLGFDTESRPCFSNDEKPHGVSLLQLSSGERAFLFRVPSWTCRRWSINTESRISVSRKWRLSSWG